jgi:hypothetical protein
MAAVECGNGATDGQWNGTDAGADADADPVFRRSSGNGHGIH